MLGSGIKFVIECVEQYVLHKKHRLIISFQNMSTGMRVLCLLPILLIDHNIIILMHVL